MILRMIIEGKMIDRWKVFLFILYNVLLGENVVIVVVDVIK